MNEYEFIISALRYVINGEAAPDISNDINWKRMYGLS